MGERNLKKQLYLPIIGIIDAELLMFYSQTILGLGLHIINFLSIILIMIFSKSLKEKEKNILYSLTLVILLRMVNISTPQFFTNTLQQYPLIYGIMFIPIYSIIKNQQISSEELGINFKKLYIYLPLAILIGFIAAISEYRILNPIAMISDLRFSNIALIALVMFVFIATAEELIFRSILQTRLEKVVGLRYGILITGIIFGIEHASYGIINEIIFAGIFGIIMGYIFQKMRNILFNISIHGTANVILFGILPFYKLI